MSALGTVFRRELGVYFRTPSGWILAALVVGLDALQLNGVAMGNERRPSAHVLEIFLLNAAFLTQAAAAVLATRLQLDPREAPLWLSAPVRARDLVLGRFGAAFVWLTLITLASLPLPALIYVHGHVSFAHVLVGYAGLLLVAASSLGVASAVATLTRRPLSAVLATAGVLAALELGYYVAFGVWKLAVILEGVYSRFLAGGYGEDAAPFFEPVGEVVFELAERASDAAREVGR